MTKKSKVQIPESPKDIIVAGYDSYEITKGHAEFLIEDMDNGKWWLEDHKWETETTSGTLADLWARTAKYRKTWKGRKALMTKWTREYANKDLDDLAFDAACDDGDIQQFAFEDCCYAIGEWLKEHDWYAETLYATVRNFGWRGLDGKKEFSCPSEYYRAQDGTSVFHCRAVGQKFLGEILPNTDCTFTIYEKTDKYGLYLHISNAHHDAPTGESYQVRPRNSYVMAYFNQFEAAKAYDFHLWKESGGFDAADYEVEDIHAMTVAYQSSPDEAVCTRMLEEFAEEFDYDMEEMQAVIDKYKNEFEDRWAIEIKRCIPRDIKNLENVYNAIVRRIENRPRKVLVSFEQAETTVIASYLQVNTKVSPELVACLSH